LKSTGALAGPAVIGPGFLGHNLVAQAPKRPNILFVIADDWGNGHASVFGAEWVKTPNVDRVAREGVVFTNCFTSNPKCSPCRSSILTGRNSWQTKEAVSHYSIFPNEFPVYPAVLEKAGYFVGLTGKGWGPGDFTSTGFAHNPAGKPWTKRTNDPPYRGISNVDYAGNFQDFLAERPANQPFCFWLGTQEPHRAYEEGSGERAGKQLSQVKLPKFYPDHKTIRSDYLDYALEVEWFDRHLGRALENLAKIGELDNTIVVVTSDHGEPFPRIKGQIYERGFHVPLMVRWGSRVKGGRTVEDFINVRDFAPTFLEAAGVGAPTTVTGRSFLKSLTADRSGFIDESRDVMLVGKERHDLGRPNDAGYPVRAIRTREWLYVRNFEPDRWPAGNPETGYRNVDDGPSKAQLLSGYDDYYRMSFGKRPAEELYDMRTDPDCINNLARSLDHEVVKRGLRDRMFEMLKEEGDPRVTGRADFFDTIQYTGPRKHAWDTWMKNQGP
jgi:N-sulfoglucosamine sulfohydrolase